MLPSEKKEKQCTLLHFSVRWILDNVAANVTIIWSWYFSVIWTKCELIWPYFATIMTLMQTGKITLWKDSDIWFFGICWQNTILADIVDMGTEYVRVVEVQHHVKGMFLQASVFLCCTYCCGIFLLTYTNIYSKPLEKGHSQKLVFKTNYCLMQVKSIAEWGAFYNTFGLY